MIQESKVMEWRDEGCTETCNLALELIPDSMIHTGLSLGLWFLCLKSEEIKMLTLRGLW